MSNIEKLIQGKKVFVTVGANSVAFTTEKGQVVNLRQTAKTFLSNTIRVRSMRHVAV